MNREIANIFWYGDLTKFEITCITSFVNNGFHVKLWSYSGLHVDGAESCDARLVLPEDHITKYKQKHFATHDESKKTYSTLAAFSDAFRWNVVNKFGGWWFDADCYCLKSSDDFEKLRHEKSFICGLQDYDCPSVNSAVFYANKDVSDKLVDTLNQVCESHNFTFDDWGRIGPLLISDVVQDYSLYDGMLSPEMFYSIEYPMINLYIDPNLKEEAKKYIQDSYVTHIWHSWINYYNVDKDNPPSGSLLEELYNHSYVNTSLKDEAISLKYKASLEHYIVISKLYKKILKRNASVAEIGNHIRSKLSMKQIKKMLQQ